jgi:YfiH family protein
LSSAPSFLRPQWGAPAGVHAACTLRGGGVSAAPWDSLNLGDHVGDDPAAVAGNRQRIAMALALPAAPRWLQQVHGTRVLDVDAGVDAGPDAATPGPADAAVTRQPGRVLAILVADCLPVLFASADGHVLAAAHAGWRGLAGGVLEATLAAMRVPADSVHAWLGPAIGADAFEVGGEVREAFLAHDAGAGAAFGQNTRGRWQCDLPLLARRRLAAAGVVRVSDAQLCTASHPLQCFSYRRDGRTGRMAALLWRDGITTAP